mmetsp:Transcript_124847/g.266406  ORF Transcript_124847/g.266406 Transcript_124847/m.266406 type:complete len:82 (-) Transcript_124847:72-317(-)
MSYVPDGPPGKHQHMLWVSNRQGDNLARMLGATLHDKGHEVSLVEVSKSNENPFMAWGKLSVEMPSVKKSTDTKKKKKPKA